MDFLAIIPAREGSKRLPMKNIKKLNGKPLIEHTINQAKKVFKKENICVSTDSKEVVDISENLGIEVPFLRPKKYAQDNSSSQEVIMHALEWYNKKGVSPDAIVLLQPTSPFRNIQHIKSAMNDYSSNLDMIVSVNETHANPYFSLFEENDKGFIQRSKESNFNRNQDCPKVWELNGSIYVINVNSLKNDKIENFKKIRKFVIDDPILTIDIDTSFDWEYAEFLISKGLFKNES